MKPIAVGGPAALLCLLVGCSASSQCTVPAVDFTIFRVDRQTFDVEGYYQFSQGYRKVTFDQAAPEPTRGFQDSGPTGKVFWWWDIQGDFTSFIFKSELTGELLLEASSIWQGSGTIEFEPSAFITTVTQVPVAEPPAAVHVRTLLGETSPDANLAWEAVRNTDATASIAALAPDYEVAIFEHNYEVLSGVGLMPAEWFVVVYTVPVAPKDFGVLSISWPQGQVTSGQPVVPETSVHNFGDAPGDVTVRAYSSTPSLVYDESSTVNVTSKVQTTMPNHPRRILAEDLTGNGVPELLLAYFQSSPLVLHRVGDDFVDWTSTMGLSGDLDGNIQAVDLENDGDLDLIGAVGSGVKVLANDGAGVFTDVTATSGLTDPAKNSDIATGDLNDDGFADVLLVNWMAPPKVYLNDTTGTMVELGGPWNPSIIYGRVAILFDYNDDDLVDIGISSTLGATEDETRIYENVGANTFVDVSATVGPLTGAFAVEAVDVDCDGALEVLLGDADSFTLLKLQSGQYSDVSSAMTPAPVASLGNGGSIVRPMLADLDTDNDVDILLEEAPYLNQAPPGCAVTP